LPSRKLRPDILTSEQALEQVDPPWSDPENDVEAVQDGRIYIEPSGNP
jgi:hypothetical protein